MKQSTVYVCETCGYKSEDFNEMREHEASHFGLTVQEMESWTALKSHVSHMGSVVSRTKNEETERKFDEAIEELLNFEKAHGIKQ